MAYDPASAELFLAEPYLTEPSSTTCEVRGAAWSQRSVQGQVHLGWQLLV